MSLIGQQVFVSPGQVFSTISGGGGGGGGVGNTLTLSTLTLGVGLDSNANNLLLGTGTLAIAQVGDSNQLQILSVGNDPTLGNQYAFQGVFANNAQGDITFGDINGANSALTAINYQAAFFNSGNISTFIYGTTEIKPDGTGGGSQLLVSSILCSSINGAAPGGGGGNVFPSLQVSSTAGQPASLYITGNDADLYNMYVSSANGITSLQLGLQGGRQELYCPIMEAPDFYTSTIKGATGQISLNPSGTEQIRIGGTGAPGDITIASVGGGNINIQGPTNVTAGLFNVPGSASISSLTASSINGAVYPPPATSLPTSFTPTSMSNYYQGNSSGGGVMFDLQDPFPSPFTFSVNNWITINGAAQAIIDFSGHGNTNNLRDSNAGTGPAHLDISLYWDNNDNNFNQYVISSWDSTAALSGSFGPTTSLPAEGTVTPNPYSFPGIFNYTDDPITGSKNFSATIFGKRTVKLKTNANIYLDSGDNTEAYTLTIRAPYINSANTAILMVSQG